MIRKAYLQTENGAFGNDERKLEAFCQAAGVKVFPFNGKYLLRNRVSLDNNSLLAGGIKSVHHALKLLGKDIPKTNCYPECLHDMMNRQFQKTTLAKFFDCGIEEKRFVRPIYQDKLFTGQIAYPSEAYSLRSTLLTEVYVVDIVNFKSEYRYYICEDHALGTSHYWGKPIRPNPNIVKEAVRRISNTQEKVPHSYAIDFGVLEDGRTALIELNEGYSIDSYDISAEIYGNVIFARWQELTA